MSADTRVPAHEVAAVADVIGGAPVDPLHNALSGTPANAIGTLYVAAESYRELLRAALDALHRAQCELARERERRFAVVEELRRLRPRAA